MNNATQATVNTTASNGTKPASNESADVTVTDSDSLTIKGNWPDGLTDVIHAIANREAQDIVDERERRENIRANHRNLNRMLTLLGALVIGLIVTYILSSGKLGAWGPRLAPYAFCITIAMDSTLAAYSFIKHY